jgi:hypothetical protein
VDSRDRERVDGSGAPKHVIPLLQSVPDEKIEEMAETEGAVDPGSVSR